MGVQVEIKDGTILIEVKGDKKSFSLRDIMVFPNFTAIMLTAFNGYFLVLGTLFCFIIFFNFLAKSYMRRLISSNSQEMVILDNLPNLPTSTSKAH